MRKGEFYIISSIGTVIVARIDFDDGSKWDISKQGYSLSDALHKKSCWIENDQIYMDENGERKLKRKQTTKITKISQEKEIGQKIESKREMNIRDSVEKSTVLDKTRLPRITREALKNADNAFDNFALKFYKAARFEDTKFSFYKANSGKVEFTPKPYFGNLDFGQIADRHRSAIEALNLSIIDCEGTIDWRLIVGLGNESVYDTSMTLHHVYGIPYIPASAVKGVVRSWIIKEIFSDVSSEPNEENYPLVNAEHRAYLDEEFCKIFGCPAKTQKIKFENSAPVKENGKYCKEKPVVTALGSEYKGNIWFFDAFPLSTPNIEVDIMNPHYGDYYNTNNKILPADYLQPNPIMFLTVGEKDCTNESLKFQFLIGIKKKDNDPIGGGGRLLKDSSGVPLKVRRDETKTLVDATADTLLLYIVEAWLKKTLEEHGIGSKTAVGYGYMKDFQAGGGS